MGGGKAKENHVVIRDLFVVNRDKKKHDSRQKDHESRFFSSLGMAPIGVGGPLSFFADIYNIGLVYA